MLRTVTIFGSTLPLRGNILTYMISYMRARLKGGEDLTYADYVFVTLGRGGTIGLTGWLGGVVANKIGLRAALAIGLTIYSGGYTLTYFAIDIGLWACVISMGVCSGLAISLCHTNITTTVMKWFPDKRGLMGSIVGLGSGGAIIWIPLQTAYVNPDNIPPVEIPGEDDRYFVDKELLDRVPSMFLLLGAIWASMQISCIFFMREPTKEELVQIQMLSESRSEKVEENGVDKSLKPQQPYSVLPSQAWKMGLFWKLWTIRITVVVFWFLVSPYVKSYAMLFIHDDAFLAQVAFLQNMMSGSSKLIFGILFDKWGFKMAHFFLTLSSAGLAFVYACLVLLDGNEVGAKVFYAVVSVVIFGITPGFFTLYPPEIMRVFGPQHTATIAGMIYSTGLASTTIQTIYLTLVFDFVGYTWTYVILGTLLIGGSVLLYFYDGSVTSEKFRPRSAEQTVDKTETENHM